MLAVGTVAVIALKLDGRFHRLDQIALADERDGIGQPRISLFFVPAFHGLVLHAHAAAEQQVITFEHHDAQVVREDVDGIILRQDEADLEFAWHIGGAVEGLDGVFARCARHLHAAFLDFIGLFVQPQFAVAGRFGFHEFSHALDIGAQTVIARVAQRGRAAGDVARDVAATALGGNQRMVDGGDLRL